MNEITLDIRNSIQESERILIPPSTANEIAKNDFTFCEQFFAKTGVYISLPDWPTRSRVQFELASKRFKIRVVRGKPVFEDDIDCVINMMNENTWVCKILRCKC